MPARPCLARSHRAQIVMSGSASKASAPPSRPNPINPALVFTELSPRLPDDCLLSGDAGTATNWLARHLVMRRGMKFSPCRAALPTMGPAVPYAIAAKFAFPDRVAIAMTGDGAMQMNGLNELLTVAKYWRRWRDPRIIFLVLNNRDLNQVSWEMRIESGDPKFDASQDLPDFPYARYAELLGLYGHSVDRPGADRSGLGRCARRYRARRVSRRTRTQRIHPPAAHHLRASEAFRGSDGRRAIPMRGASWSSP